MKHLLRALPLGLLLCAAGSLSAATICPSTSSTTTDCNFLVTIAAGGTASVTTVAGSTAFNGPQTFTDGSMDPGNDGSLVGVINNSTQGLSSFTLTGAGATAGIFDFSFNGICVYTNGPYCGTASTGYEGPTSTFSNLTSTMLFETTQGTVNFAPTLAAGSSTFFSIEDNPTDIASKGGLTVAALSFASTTSAVPEPSDVALLLAGMSVLLALGRRKPAVKV